jgi:hypothetical protein
VGLSGLVSSVAEWACVGLYPVVSLAQGELDKYPRDEEGNSEQNTTYLQYATGPSSCLRLPLVLLLATLPLLRSAQPRRTRVGLTSGIKSTVLPTRAGVRASPPPLHPVPAS